MNYEPAPSVEKIDALKTEVFEKMWEKLPEDGCFIEFEGNFPKHEFLEFLVKNKNVVLHGTPLDVDRLEPRKANDTAKKFGNLLGVYATQDSVIPIFHAIRDKRKYAGTTQSGTLESRDDSGNVLSKKYRFAMDKDALAESPWSEGIVYILPKEKFQQGTNDQGEPSNEFVSLEPVKPRAKLRISPKDFPYLDKIKPLEKSTEGYKLDQFEKMPADGDASAPEIF